MRDRLTRCRKGSSNIAVGFGALSSNTTGSSNIGIGTSIEGSGGDNLTTGSNNIDIGNGGVFGESNTIRIGKSGTQTATFIAGINGATSSSGVAVFVNSSGQLGTTTSSARFKNDIQDMGDSTSALMQLRPVGLCGGPDRETIAGSDSRGGDPRRPVAVGRPRTASPLVPSPIPT